MNGKTTLDIADPDNTFRSGYIGLRGSNKTVEFRKIEIKELKPEVAPPVGATPGFTPLFNGKDLTGWKQEGKATGAWRVENGILIGSGVPGRQHLYTLREDFKNFHLRVETRVNQSGAAAVYCRAERNPPAAKNMFAGYSALVNALKPGSLQAFYTDDYKAAFAKTVLAKADEWFVLDMLAEDNRVNIKVNGTTAIDYVDKEPQPRKSGSILLNYFAAGTVLEFRKIEIKELPAP